MKSNDRDRSNDLTIGRVIMDLGVSRNEFFPCNKPESKHKSIVIKIFWRDENEYFQRIERILKEAKEKQVDILIFPACAFIWTHTHHLRRYMRAMKKMPWVVAGILRLPRHKKQVRYIESAKVWSRGRKVFEIEYGTLIWIQLGKVSSMVAIAPGLKQLCTGPSDIAHTSMPRPSTGLLGISIDSHPPSRHWPSLAKIFTALKDWSEGNTQVLRANWKFEDTRQDTDWLISRKTKRMTYETLEIPYGKGNSTDTLDVLTMPDWKNNPPQKEKT